MQTIVTDVRGVCPSVCQSVCHAAQLGGACSVYGAFTAAFARLLWPLSLFSWCLEHSVPFCPVLLFFFTYVHCILLTSKSEKMLLIDEDDELMMHSLYNNRSMLRIDMICRTCHASNWLSLFTSRIPSRQAKLTRTNKRFCGAYASDTNLYAGNTDAHSEIQL